MHRRNASRGAGNGTTSPDATPRAPCAQYPIGEQGPCRAPDAGGPRFTKRGFRSTSPSHDVLPLRAGRRQRVRVLRRPRRPSRSAPASSPRRASTCARFPAGAWRSSPTRRSRALEPVAAALGSLRAAGLDVAVYERGARRADRRLVPRGGGVREGRARSTATSRSAAVRSSTRARRRCSTRPTRPTFART